MQRIHFEVLGNPQAQKRHRDRKWGGKFDPSALDKADFLALCRDNAPEKPIEGPVILRLVCWMPVLKNATKRFKIDVENSDCMFEGLRGEIGWNLLCACLDRSVAYSKSRYDADNQLKFVMDALAGVYWQNDGQVQVGWAYRIYSHRPRTEIEIIF